MVAQQILVLFVGVRVLLGEKSGLFVYRLGRKILNL